ncbi:hypothetical protein [Longispora urticae]
MVDRGWSLLPGESRLWEGEPERLLWLTSADRLVMAAVGLPAVPVVAVLVLGPGVPWGLAVLIALVVAAAMAGRPVMRALALSSTRYTVTNERVVVFRDGLIVTDVRFHPRAGLGAPVLRWHDDGTGSVSFGQFPDAWDADWQLVAPPRLPRLRFGVGRLLPPNPAPVLWRVERAQQVFDLLDSRA